MNCVTRTPSLIYYLKPIDARFHLKLSMSKEEGVSQSATRSPFLIVSQSDPLALILEGSILSDAGTKIKDVFILIQKDEYHLPKDESSPIYNRDVDQAWQGLFSFLATLNQNDSIVILKDQVGDGHRLLPWSPLLYCHHRQIFFEPSCPTCGFPLEMCYDDELLIGLGLRPYSTSLKRYLFCPHCLDKQSGSEFYTHSLDVGDSAILKDQQDLVCGFGRLARDGNRNANIPCLECANLRECYETEHLSVSRIVTVSFYPFFMLVLPAPSIHLLDFLPMLAGADPEDPANQLQVKGQSSKEKRLRDFKRDILQKSPFFFPKDERFFLEVLYLKLWLLGELAQIAFSGSDIFKCPDLGPSIDHIWVKVAEQSGLLPSFWSFRPKLLGFGLSSNQGPFTSKLPPSRGLHFLGSLWFYVLLVNARQDFSKVYREVAKIVENTASKEDVAGESLLRRPFPEVFSPQNVFWSPGERGVDGARESHWARALELGFLLLKRSMSEISQWSEAEFWHKFEGLKKAIEDELSIPETGFVRISPGTDSEAVHEILMKIAKRWRRDSQTTPPVLEVGAETLLPEEPGIDREDADLSEDLVKEETVILTPEDFRDEPSPPRIPENGLPETVVRKPQAAEPSETPETPLQGEEDLPKTVILERDVSETETRSHVESQESEIPATVVISRQDLMGPPSDSDQKGASPGGGSSERTEESTLKTSKDPAEKQKSRNVEDEDEDLPKTVILDPSKTRKEP